MYRLIFLLFLPAIIYAEMPSLRGYIACESSIMQDSVKDYLQSQAANTVKSRITSNYTATISTGTGAYIVNFNINFKSTEVLAATNLENWINANKDNFKNYCVSIWKSNNDGIPGLCIPDTIEKILKK